MSLVSEMSQSATERSMTGPQIWEIQGGFVLALCADGFDGAGDGDGRRSLVHLTSRGPVIYRQTRLGLHGRRYTIYKIRSMYHDCERLTGARWSTPGDNRVTWIGKILRATHIDELPQLWNILRGDMSLVGPRPERPEIASGSSWQFRAIGTGWRFVRASPGSLRCSYRRHRPRQRTTQSGVRPLLHRASQLVARHPSHRGDEHGILRVPLRSRPHFWRSPTATRLNGPTATDPEKWIRFPKVSSLFPTQSGLSDSSAANRPREPVIPSLAASAISARPREGNSPSHLRGGFRRSDVPMHAIGSDQQTSGTDLLASDRGRTVTSRSSTTYGPWQSSSSSDFDALLPAFGRHSLEWDGWFRDFRVSVRPAGRDRYRRRRRCELFRRERVLHSPQLSAVQAEGPPDFFHPAFFASVPTPALVSLPSFPMVESQIRFFRRFRQSGQPLSSDPQLFPTLGRCDQRIVLEPRG